MTFHQQHVWEGYSGSPADTVDVEIYQAWLKPATKSQLEKQQHGAHHAHQHKHEEGHHGVGQQHGDPQAIDHGDHVHEGRTVVEQNAIDLEGQDDAERRRLSEALIQANASSPCLTSVFGNIRPLQWQQVSSESMSHPAMALLLGRYNLCGVST